MDVINEQLLKDIVKNLQYYVEPVSSTSNGYIDFNKEMDKMNNAKIESERIIRIIKNSLDL